MKQKFKPLLYDFSYKIHNHLYDRMGNEIYVRLVDQLKVPLRTPPRYQNYDQLYIKLYNQLYGQLEGQLIEVINDETKV